MTIDEGGSDRSCGDMIVLSTGDVSVVMEARHATRLGDRVQAALLHAQPLTSVLTVLTEAGLGEAPEFAYIASEGRGAVRVALRGRLLVEVRDADGAERAFSAQSLNTWTESLLEGCADVTIRSNPSDPGLVRLVLGPPPVAEEEPARPSALATMAPPAPDDDVDLSHLFETRHSGVEAAAVRLGGDSTTEAPAPATRLAPAVDLGALPPPSGLPVDLSAPRPDPTPGVLGDHDGLTIAPGALAALRDGLGDGKDPRRPTTAVRGLGPTVRAVTCPSGHLNPPHADRCRSCQAGISDQAPVVVARPSLGYLSFDTGLVTDIDRPLVIGRKPTAGGLATGGEPPGLVVLADPDGSLSRTHAEVRVEGWEVLIVDRGSTNGTLVELPGEEPVLLRPDEPYIITPGTVVRFAEAVTCRYEAGPR